MPGRELKEGEHMEELKEKKICPLLMIAKACRNHAETHPINPQCMGEACAWYRKNTYKGHYEKQLPPGWCILTGPMT